MKFTINKEDLFSAVAAVSRAVSNKNTLPILSGILIQSQGLNKICFKATDLELAMECTVDADIEAEGLIVAPGRNLLDLVRHLPNGPIVFESNSKEELIIKYDQSQINIHCFDADEFPALPMPEDGLSGLIAVKMFKRMVKQVSIAVATDEVRPLFTGILLEFNGSKLIMVASDTHRLAKAEGSWQGDGIEKLIIPGRTMQEIARLAGNDEGMIEITVGNNQAYFKLDNIVFVSRVISGKYPDYKQVLPAENLYKTHTKIEKNKLSESLERASLLSRDTAKGKANIVCLNWQQNSLILTADSPDIGNIHEELPASLEGESLEASYNAKYLLDALKVIEENNIAFHLTGQTTPGIIIPQAEQKEEADTEQNSDQKIDYIYLVLPVRVSR